MAKHHKLEQPLLQLLKKAITQGLEFEGQAGCSSWLPPAAAAAVAPAGGSGLMVLGAGLKVPQLKEGLLLAVR